MYKIQVDMLTNAISGIVQQLGIENYYASTGVAAATAGSGITVREKPDKSLPDTKK